jgi:hypothetical protein
VAYGRHLCLSWPCRTSWPLWATAVPGGRRRAIGGTASPYNVSWVQFRAPQMKTQRAKSHLTSGNWTGHRLLTLATRITAHPSDMQNLWLCARARMHALGTVTGEYAPDREPSALSTGQCCITPPPPPTQTHTHTHTAPSYRRFKWKIMFYLWLIWWPYHWLRLYSVKLLGD